MKRIKFTRDTIARFNRQAKCLVVNQVISNDSGSTVSQPIGFIYQAKRITEHPDAPCWILESAAGRRDIHETQRAAKDDARKMA